MGLPSERLEQYRTQIDTIAGVLQRLDSYLFEAIDSAQDRHGITGHLLEIGVYQGRSAIVLGFLRKNSEQLHLCDPFEAPSVDSPNFLADTLDWYNGYNQDLVEANYLRFHDQLPHIHACSSRELHDRLEPALFCFIHLDGSHDEETIHSDFELARKLLVDGGVLAISGYRNVYTLELAAAVWKEVATSSLVPLCATESHLFVSWSPAQLAEPDDLLARFEAIPQAIVERKDAVPVIRSLPVQERTLRSTVRSFVPPVLWPLAHRLASLLSANGDH